MVGEKSAVSSIDPHPLAGWTPIHVEMRRAAPVVEWCRLGSLRFTDPFFQQTIARAMRDPACLLFQRQTSFADLPSVAEKMDTVRPSGFIFHLSRCGSTLVAQSLAASSHSIVISEAPSIDQLLTSRFYRPEITDEQRVQGLRGLIAGLTQRRFAEEQHGFVKFDSWHILELPLIRAAFPDVPWIFLYRDPVEIMVSQRRLRGTQMIPGLIDPRIYGMDAATVAALPMDVYGARVLARIAAAGLEHAARSGGRLVNFSQLGATFWPRLADFFGLEFTSAESERIRRVSETNAKNPYVTYEDDTPAKQREANDSLRQLVEETVGPVYRELEALRSRQEEAEGSGQQDCAAGVCDQALP